MTRNNDCNQLDAYLTDDLSVDDARRFESHLKECSTCREAIDEQNWIDNLLRSPVRTQIERAPATIRDSFRSSLSGRRRVLQVACGLAAAAVLVVAVGWLELNTHRFRKFRTSPLLSRFVQPPLFHQKQRSPRPTQSSSR
jgi:predicted anti-sigma-YlaC factor YlaD